MTGDDADLAAMLQKSEQRAALFESIMESMGESVLLVDRQGKEIYGNKELRRFRGDSRPDGDVNAWRRPEVMKIFDADGHELAPEDWPVARALRGDYKTNFEIRVQGMAHTPGEVVLAISTRSLVDSSGRIEGAVVVTRDITAVRQTEESLRQSQKLETIGQLTGGVAHDFNNMLSAILSSAEVLKNGVGNDERLALAAVTIERAALRGADLTRHLLAFARKQALQPASVDVGALVQETLLLLRPALGATIDVSVAADEGAYALADAAQLTSALLNLCINARDAMGESGKLKITALKLARPQGAVVRISVSDNGAGMSSEIMKRAIEPFFTTKGVGNGSGLGLSMAFGFAQQSGGDLQIESAVGVGTTVSITLPAASAPAVSKASPPDTMPTGKLRILVVDDDELVRDALSLQLADEGFDVVTADDGVAALELIDGGLTFDVLLTDMVMPRGLGGLALAKAVTALRPNVRTIVSTGYVDKEISPANDVVLLRKPYSAAELLGALRAAMLAQS